MEKKYLLGRGSKRFLLKQGMPIFSGLQILFQIYFVIFILSDGRWPCTLFQTRSAIPVLQEKVQVLLKGRD